MDTKGMTEINILEAIDAIICADTIKVNGSAALITHHASPEEITTKTGKVKYLATIKNITDHTAMDIIIESNLKAFVPTSQSDIIFMNPANSITFSIELFCKKIISLPQTEVLEVPSKKGSKYDVTITTTGVIQANVMVDGNCVDSLESLVNNSVNETDINWEYLGNVEEPIEICSSSRV